MSLHYKYDNDICSYPTIIDIDKQESNTSEEIIHLDVFPCCSANNIKGLGLHHQRAQTERTHNMKGPRLDRPTLIKRCGRTTVTDSDAIGSHSESDKLESPKARVMFLPKPDSLCRIPIRYYVELFT